MSFGTPDSDDARLDQAAPPSPDLVWLADPRAADTSLTGAKASNLAVARRAGLPVFDGFVITTLGTSELDHPLSHRSCADSPLHDAWRRLSHGGELPLAVRSSSVAEDSTTSSMAGRFVSVLHVLGWEAFVDAVFEVVASAAIDGDRRRPDGRARAADGRGAARRCALRHRSADRRPVDVRWCRWSKAFPTRSSVASPRAPRSCSASEAASTPCRAHCRRSSAPATATGWPGSPVRTRKLFGAPAGHGVADRPAGHAAPAAEPADHCVRPARRAQPPAGSGSGGRDVP